MLNLFNCSPIALLIGYIAFMIIVAGLRGGVRDEMEGIVDVFAIAFWPIYYFCKGLYLVFKTLYSIGFYFRN